MDLQSLRNALDDLPVGLEQTYSRILAKVDARNQEKAVAMLQLLVWAKRALTLNELVDALAIQQGKDRPYYDPRNKMPVPRELVKILPGLVILDRVERSSKRPGEPAQTLVQVWVRLAHLSVKEYFTSGCVQATFKPSLRKLSAHIAIVDMCIAHFYNNYPESHVLGGLLKGQYKDGGTRDLPYFVHYLRYWAEHAKLAQADESASERIVALLTSGLHSDSPFKKSLRFTQREWPVDETDEIIDMTALIYASANGLDRVVSRLLERDPQTIDELDIHCRLTALGTATENCHEETVRILLANKATPSINTVPQVSATRSDETVIALRILKMLVDHGAKPTYVALIWANELGNIQLIKFLLDNGAPMSTNNEPPLFRHLCSGNILHVACLQGLGVDTVSLFLDYGANALVKDFSGMTALGRVLDNIQLGKGDINKEFKLRMCSILSKAMWQQLRSAQGVSQTRRKRPRTLRYKKELTSRKRMYYGLTFHSYDSDDY